MIAIFMTTLIGGSLFKFTSQDMFFVNRLKKSMQAKYLAEAGLARALSTLGADWDNRLTPGNFPSTALAGGAYDASVATTGGRTLVSSVGTVDGVARTVTAEVEEPTISALNYILAGGGSMDLRLTAHSTCNITGDIYATGNIEMRANASGAVINLTTPGNAYAGGTISSSGGGINVAGSLNSNYGSVVGFPVFDYNYFQTIATTNGYYYNGDRTYNSSTQLPVNPSGGVIFVNGNVSIADAQSTTQLCLVATGNITISRGTTTLQQFADYPAMLSQGNITIRSTGNSAQGRLVATGLVYAGGNFSLSGNHNSAVVTGSIIARGTLEETGTQCALTMTYVAQNPSGMISSGGSGMAVESYNL